MTPTCLYGFGFPVVPQGAARLRCQISAAHTRDHLDRAINAIVEVAQKFEVVAKATFCGSRLRAAPAA